MLGDVGVVDPIAVLGTSHGAEDAEDASAAADIEDHLPIEEVFVLENGVFVGEGSRVRKLDPLGYLISSLSISSWTLPTMKDLPGEARFLRVR